MHAEISETVVINDNNNFQTIFVSVSVKSVIVFN